MNSKEYKLPNGKTAVFEYDVCGIGKITLECMDELMGMIADRPQGEWIKHDEDRDYCSVCKHIFKTRTLTKQDKWTTYVDDLGYNFCPNCGAKMKGASDDVRRKT